MRVKLGEDELIDLMHRLGTTISAIGLLIKALIHSSYAKEYPDTPPYKRKELPDGIKSSDMICESVIDNDKDNERLEFLGDAVLKLVISEELMKRYPHKSEGELSKIRAYVVSGKALAHVAERYRLGDLILLGKSAEMGGGRSRRSVLADTMEAVYGAIYLDRGLSECKRVILDGLANAIDDYMESDIAVNYKEVLQEYLQKDSGITPEYRIVGSKGPDHDRVFFAETLYKDSIIGKGQGKSKKAATQKAAKDALLRLKIISR